MKPRTIKLSVSVMGMARMPIATVVIQKFADQHDWKKSTALICPECGKKPKYHSGYECECGFKGATWQSLKRVLKATKEAIVKPRLIQPKEDVLADLFCMSIEEFSKYIDATRAEYGVTVTDETSARNLKKLIIATEKLGKVILLRYNDTYEKVVGILTLSMSNRVIIKDIIPLNLLEAKETVRVNIAEVKPEELAEAEAFVKMLPEAEEEQFNVDDYRTLGLEEKPISEKVLELEAIISMTKEKAKVIA